MTEAEQPPLKNTPLAGRHEAAGARMAPFAGYRMPIKYTGIIPEHHAVRTGVGLFDLSHMGEIEVSGPGMLEFLERMTTNDVGSVGQYQAQYTLMLNEQGGIVDDLVLYHLPGKAFLVVNAANIEKDFDWLQSHAPEGIQLRNRSHELALIAIQGPQAEAVLGRMISYNLADIGYYHAAVGNVDGTPVLISRTGYTGEDGFELYLPNALAEPCWDAALEIGAEHGIQPIGLGARDTLRLEMKYALYGLDIDDTTSPIEAGLGWVVKIDKDFDFIGREQVAEMKKSGPKRRLIAFEMDERAIPRSDCEIQVDGSAVGRVTSGTHSPSCEKGVGLGYVNVPHTKAGTRIAIVIRGKNHPATIIKPPFVKNTSRR
ncbi:MAG: glycine cleavage system aminomethyltransferase GcvT [Acidobacteria bacterium]|nr:glycine cleavage system aminomethyltransferase GcvT [Acidobacteriota bacterium]